MGRDRYQIYDNRYPHFVTCTFVRWLPLFSFPPIFQIVLASLEYLREHDRFELFGWVCMEHHCHLIARSPDLSKSIAHFKSYTAKQIVAFLQERGNRFYLEELHFAKKFHKTLQEFQVWQEGFHPEQILDRPMMEQKMKYIHNNPVVRGYVDRAEEWRYSSARNYLGKSGLLPVITKW